MLKKALTYEVSETISVHRVVLRCECGGTMVHDGMHTFGYPCQFTHKCDMCGAVDCVLTRYPRIEYRDKNGEVLSA